MLAGVLLGLGASACWAIANVAVQRSSRSVGPFRALFWALVVGTALAAVTVPFLDVRAQPFRPMPDLLWLLAAGGSSLLAYVCMFYAFEHGRLSLAVPVVSSWAVLAAALSLVLFDVRPRGWQLAGGLAVAVGALVVSRFAQREARASAEPGGARWLAASAGAAVGFGILIPVMGRLAAFAGEAGSVGLIYVADIVLGVPLARWRRVSLAAPPRSAWLDVALAGLFETAGFLCIALGARYAPLALVSPLSSLASAFTVLYAWLVLRERPAPPVLAGAALVCAGILIMAL